MSISTASCNAPRRPELAFAGVQGISQPRPAYVPGRSTRHRSFLRSVQNLPTPEQEIAELVADIDGVPVIVRILVTDLSAVPSDLASKVDLSAKLSNLLEKMVEKMWGTSLEGGHEPKQALASAEHLARPPTLSNDTLLRVGPLELDLLDRTARRGDRRIKLRPREFQLLKYMMQRADQLLTRAALLKEVWNYKFVPQTNLVDVHMGRLRRKIDELHESALIRNVRGVGFVLSATPFLK
jgi:DNA-binding winged helix-turn-helix (wHTH) protein